MEFDPELWLRIKDKKITAHQIRILSELAKTHSQTKAANNLQISVPVLHRHLKSLITKLGLELVATTANGTWLTTEGKLVLKIHERYSEMLRPEQATTLHCTPITHDLLVETISGLEAKGEKYQISINDDWQNLKALYLGRADLVIFDDPNYAIEFEGFKEDKILIIDLYKDTLIHHRNGSRYIKFKYGAQRLGFRHLDAANKKYKILYETSSLKQLINSKYSFFLNHSIIQQNNISLSNNDDSQMFIHPIMAISINPTEKIRELAKSLKQHSAAISYSGDK